MMTLNNDIHDYNDFINRKIIEYSDADDSMDSFLGSGMSLSCFCTLTVPLP